MAEPTGTVLVADDEPANRELLQALLEFQGFDVLEAVDGASTLQIVQDSPPDLILLDVMMPAPSGFEVCEKLKQNKATAHIPILLVTALSDRNSRLKGIKAGANDFITKPIDTADTVLRVVNALKMKRLHDLAQERFERLKELEGMRQQMVDMLVHDFKSPLTAVLGYLSLVRQLADERLNDEERRMMEAGLSSGERLQRMITSMLELSKLDQSEQKLQIERVAVSVLLAETLETISPSLDVRKVEVETEVDGELFLDCDRAFLRRVLENLADNALRHMPLEGPKLSLRAFSTNDDVRFEVVDNGPGIEPERQGQIFAKYSTDGARTYSQGLGLAFCKEAVDLHGGRIGIESEYGRGSCFFFEIPKSSEPGDRIATTACVEREKKE